MTEKEDLQTERREDEKHYYLPLQLISVEVASRLGIEVDTPVFTDARGYGSRVDPHVYIAPDLSQSGVVMPLGSQEKEGLFLYSDMAFLTHKFDLLRNSGFVAVVTPQGKIVPQAGIGVRSEGVRLEEIRAFCISPCLAVHSQGNLSIQEGFLVNEGENLRALCKAIMNLMTIEQRIAEEVIPFEFQIVDGQVNLQTPNYKVFTRRFIPFDYF